MIEWKKDCKLKGIKFVYEGPREPLAALNIDAEKIRAALHNLMVNAIFYTSSGGSVDLSLSKTAKAARFTVKDTGIGIPAGEQTRIFTRFYRASNAATMLTDASGLGLYIAKRFVEMHGGKIGFSSKEGEGSSFWIELPLA